MNTSLPTTGKPLLGIVIAVLLASPLIFARPVAADPQFAQLFQDHAVLQRDRPIPVWGDASPGEQLTVSLGGNELKVRADAAGHWRTLLTAMKGGGPFSLSIHSTSGASQTVHDVLLGDVFLCGGQSNMELPVSRTFNAEREIANAGNGTIRVLTVAHSSSPVPLTRFAAPVSWTAATSDSIRDFSAACYYFARELQKTVPVALGLINASWSGSRIEPWISATALKSIGTFNERLDLLRVYAGNAKAGDQRLGEVWESWWHSHVSSEPWKSADGEWRDVPEPMRDWKTWDVPELKNHDGMVWFQRSVTLTPQQAAMPATLELGGIDEVDETWVNGRPIGNTFGYGTARSYSLPAGVLRAGENVIVVNVLSVYDAAGMYGPTESMALRLADGSSLTLGGHWRYQGVPESYGYPPRAPWESVSGLTTLYNGMIAPLGTYGLKGVLWYQGESNTGESAQYQNELRALLGDWRRSLGADLPFLVVQLPSFGAPSGQPMESDWANLREAQRRAVLADAHAALIVTLDVGEPRELHPPDKQSVGRRLARAAMHLIYGATPSASGPRPVATSRDGQHILVTFSGIDRGWVTLSFKHPTGFELCGAPPNSCHYVDAEVRGDAIALDVRDLDRPSRVRFCWGDSPLCNLYDGSGMPAGPFEIAVP